MVRTTTKKTRREAPKKPTAARKKSSTKKSTRKKNEAGNSEIRIDSAAPSLPIEEYRQRLGAVGRLMRAAMADLETDQPGGDRIGQGAYLQVMGRAFEVLDGLSQTIDVDDLVKISKVIAEQRRAELNHRKLQLEIADEKEAPRSRAPQANKNGRAATGDYTLPDSFGEVVRQIYGTTLATDIENPK